MESIIILIIFPLLISCQTNSFDLDKLSFPIDRSVIEKNYELIKNSDLSGIIVYNSTDSALLQFSGFSFSGTLNKQDTFILSTDYVSFYENRITKQMNAYKLEIRTIPKAEEFEKLLEKLIFTTEIPNFRTGYGIPAISFTYSKPTIQEDTIMKNSNHVICMLLLTEINC